MKNHKRIQVMFLVIFVVLVSFQQIAVNGQSNTIVVPDDYSFIQEAIDNALEGDTVYVKKGIYHENLGINKSIFLIGEDRDLTIIDGNTSQSYRVPININCYNVTVSGFTLRYGYAGIQFQGGENCTISGNKIADAQFGIRGGTWNNITDNTFENIGLGGAIRFDGSTHNIVQKNFIKSCTEGVQVMWGSDLNTVSENTIIGCEDVGIRLQESDGNIVTRNIVRNTGVGISIYIANNNEIIKNNFINNTIEVGADEWYARQWGYGYSINKWEQNYYSDYNGTDADSDGIGETSYLINEKNQDNYPLSEPMELPEIPEFHSWTIFPLLLIGSLAVIVVKKRLFS
ncbi:MAG: right-handed parallel beta-helix repeat-containing protein [Candidatus Bathyarchaeota archaeon]|nr:right-handed parallel beta-helix repeat-containing protein [Candidatus Bathyarchaeum sp.]